MARALRYHPREGSAYGANLCEPESVLVRVRGEYLEMPGLRLTAAQAQRLWGLDTPAARSVIDALVAAGFLRRTSEGTFVRADSDSPRC